MQEAQDSLHWLIHCCICKAVSSATRLRRSFNFVSAISHIHRVTAFKSASVPIPLFKSSLLFNSARRVKSWTSSSCFFQESDVPIDKASSTDSMRSQKLDASSRRAIHCCIIIATCSAGYRSSLLSFNCIPYIRFSRVSVSRGDRGGRGGRGGGGSFSPTFSPLCSVTFSQILCIFLASAPPSVPNVHLLIDWDQSLVRSTLHS